ncbi:unnamed protein product [Acanthoscelides obtectus]|uniref:Protein aurora borealis n=1 Tax=Acanthoscelides obtectus TaxID=200917 RepID=A0A9P0P254_ACAOB|nr:unnamed protein product [Acanthoscelides obtectus]CAH1966782.1 unnamed protein product [Acanthoscelides obtectus]CAK1658250.1 Protein aurora borealis [Acanthoscelides obtectus]CAK1658251.1 Protein aurora borealis [Acanthoscelides obtectus]
MDFKYINDRNITPKNTGIFSSTLTNAGENSPISLLPTNSTPPTRNSTIFNPFEQQLIHRLHLPVFSPSVFAKVSTPNKSQDKFKWTIEDISSLKPADIDDTVSQHVLEEDPQVESLIQQRIEAFFSSEHVIVPSPDNGSINPERLLESMDSDTTPKRFIPHNRKIYSPSSAKSGNATYDTEDQDMMSTSDLHQRLFDFEDQNSSPAISTGMSPIQFSPLSDRLVEELVVGSRFECPISPIAKKPSSIISSPLIRRGSRSACRLDFTQVSMECCEEIEEAAVVPDVDDVKLDEEIYDSEPDFNSLEN